MIERKLKTTQGTLRVKLPDQLKEVTLGQIIAMQAKPDLNDLDAISILSGTPLIDLQNVLDIEDFEAFGDAVLALSNQIKHLYNSDVIPAKVTFIINGEKVNVNVIKTLSVEPAGAFMAAREVIADEINEHIKQYGDEDWQEKFNPSLKACSQVLAHYFYCRVTGKPYNEYRVEEFVETVKNLGVLEALPIAKHFFMSYPDLSRRRTSFFLELRLLWKRRRASNRSKSLSI